MLIERNTPTGSITISEIIGGYLVSRTYFGYTEQEAREMFAAEFEKGN